MDATNNDNPVQPADGPSVVKLPAEEHDRQHGPPLDSQATDATTQPGPASADSSD